VPVPTQYSYATHTRLGRVFHLLKRAARNGQAGSLLGDIRLDPERSNQGENLFRHRDQQFARQLMLDRGTLKRPPVGASSKWVPSRWGVPRFTRRIPFWVVRLRCLQPSGDSRGVQEEIYTTNKRNMEAWLLPAPDRLNMCGNSTG